jgi:hypothetical protein
MNRKYRDLWRFLFEAIDEADDPETIGALEELLDVLLPIVEPARNDIGHSLWLWLGLKVDSPEMAADFRQTILDAEGAALGLPKRRTRAR